MNKTASSAPGTGIVGDENGLRAGIVLGWLMTGLGFGLILRAESGVWLMVTGLFIMLNAQVEISAARIAGNLAGVKVRDLTWFGVAEAGVDVSMAGGWQDIFLPWQLEDYAALRAGGGRPRLAGAGLPDVGLALWSPLVIR